MLTASDIKSYCPEHTVLVLIIVLKGLVPAKLSRRAK